MSYTHDNKKNIDLFYYDPKVIDLSRLRQDAETRSKGDVRHAGKPATIHYHKFGERCFGHDHENYLDGKRVEKK